MSHNCTLVFEILTFLTRVSDNRCPSYNALMKVFICGISALQFLLAYGSLQRRAFGARSGYSLKPTRAIPRSGVVPDGSTVRRLGFPEGIRTNTLHVNVADASSRGRSSLLTYHVWTGPERGSYLTVDDIYCVQTPEACFAQLAEELKFAHLVELGMLLCGTYVPEDFPGVAHADLEPLSTPEKLTRYVERLHAKKGLRNARMALRYVLPGSASPQESKLGVAFGLPTRHGGFGMQPVLNDEIKLTDQARGLSWARTRKPDLYWPDKDVCLDYDSREWHDLQARGDADERRRNELAAMGLKGIVARPSDVRDAAALEALALQVASAMGVTPRESKTKDLAAKRFSLFQDLYGKNQWNPAL